MNKSEKIGVLKLEIAQSVYMSIPYQQTVNRFQATNIFI